MGAGGEGVEGGKDRSHDSGIWGGSNKINIKSSQQGLIMLIKMCDNIIRDKNSIDQLDKYYTFH